MAEAELKSSLSQLHQILSTEQQQPSGSAASLLSRAKLALLHLNALVPGTQTPESHLQLARETLEAGALISIRNQDPDSFTRYYQQLAPFYSLPASALSRRASQEIKITGLYLLLLLSQGDYAGFHTLLERLELASAGSEADQEERKRMDEDEFVQYPIRLEQWLMEGSYDRVWEETKGDRCPGVEFGIFSGVLINTIRSEIASCLSRAYPALPISSAKNLLFLESEGAVLDFASAQGWSARDGRIWFPPPPEGPGGDEAALAGAGKDVMSMSGRIIENALGYARQLETIV